MSEPRIGKMVHCSTGLADICLPAVVVEVLGNTGAVYLNVHTRNGLLAIPDPVPHEEEPDSADLAHNSWHWACTPKEPDADEVALIHFFTPTGIPHEIEDDRTEAPLAAFEPANVTCDQCTKLMEGTAP